MGRRANAGARPAERRLERPNLRVVDPAEFEAEQRIANLEAEVRRLNGVIETVRDERDNLSEKFGNLSIAANLYRDALASISSETVHLQAVLTARESLDAIDFCFELRGRFLARSLAEMVQQTFIDQSPERWAALVSMADNALKDMARADSL